jgi:uncharacterized membrane protein
MKNFDDIEKFVRRGKPVVKTNRQLDKQTLDDSYAVMEKTIESTSKDYKSGTLKFAVRNRTMKILATAAAIIMVIGLFLGRDKYKQEVPAAGNTELSPQETKLISMMSLRSSYQQGGFDALDKQFRDTLDVLGPRSSGISMKELLEGTNGS